MNPFLWRREHQIALVFAALFGACVGSFIGFRHFDPDTNLYWLDVGIWGVAGLVFGAMGGVLRQLLRDRKSN